MNTTGTPAESYAHDMASGPELNGTQTWAICCSGGGIRSASYCLGALQGLEAAGLLGKARLILGVSGGSYIAASRALVAHGLEQSPAGPDADPAGLPPYAPGSPEEQHLRDNSRYLAPDAKTMLAGVLSLLFGVAVTLVLVLTPVFAVAHVWGWVLRAGGALTYTVAPHSRTPQWTATLDRDHVVDLAGHSRRGDGGHVPVVVGHPDTRARGQEHSNVAAKALGWAAFVTLSLALAMFAVPAVIAWLSGAHAGAFKTVLDDLGFSAGAAWSPAAIGTFVAAVIAVSQSARKTLVKYNLLKSPEAAQGGDAPQPGVAAKAIGYLRGLPAALAGQHPGRAGVRGGGAALGEGRRGGRIHRRSGVAGHRRARGHAGHAFPGRRQPDIAARLLPVAAGHRCSVIRDTSQPGGRPAPFGTKDFPGALLSGLSGQRPELVMCTTANINAYREVPPGRGGLSFSFDPDHATLRGPGPAESVQARTVDYEALVGQRRFTLFDVSAISGAAFSPLMGRRRSRPTGSCSRPLTCAWVSGCRTRPSSKPRDRSLTTRTTSTNRTTEATAGGTRSGCCCGTCCRIPCGGAGTRCGSAGGAAMGLRAEAAQPGDPGPSSTSAACFTTRCSPPWACCTPKPSGTPATAARGCASPTEGITTTSDSSKPCNGHRNWALLTSWSSTPAATRRTPGSPSAGPSRWPGPTRLPR